ncbi:hypothetical protein K1719_007127 [Acacia pycnantha]|nr:hypothetical protein K1719_007127 [Acacia pycnantha]
MPSSERSARYLVGISFTVMESLRQATQLCSIYSYCAVHDVGKAISTFYAYKRFSFQDGMEEFQGLLLTLCRYKNLEEPEHFLFCSKNVGAGSNGKDILVMNGNKMMYIRAMADCKLNQQILLFSDALYPGLTDLISSLVEVIQCKSVAYR